MTHIIYMIYISIFLKAGPTFHTASEGRGRSVPPKGPPGARYFLKKTGGKWAVAQHKTSRLFEPVAKRLQNWLEDSHKIDLTRTLPSPTLEQNLSMLCSSDRNHGHSHQPDWKCRNARWIQDNLLGRLSMNLL